MFIISIKCSDPGSNWGPIPLQGSALPTELSEQRASSYTEKNDLSQQLKIAFELFKEAVELLLVAAK